MPDLSTSFLATTSVGTGASQPMSAQANSALTSAADADDGMSFETQLDAMWCGRQSLSSGSADTPSSPFVNHAGASSRPDRTNVLPDDLASTPTLQTSMPEAGLVSKRQIIPKVVIQEASTGSSSTELDMPTAAQCAQGPAESGNGPASLTSQPHANATSCQSSHTLAHPKSVFGSGQKSSAAGPEPGSATSQPEILPPVPPSPTGSSVSAAVLRRGGDERVPTLDSQDAVGIASTGPVGTSGAAGPHVGSPLERGVVAAAAETGPMEQASAGISTATSMDSWASLTVGHQVAGHRPSTDPRSSGGLGVDEGSGAAAVDSIADGVASPPAGLGLPVLASSADPRYRRSEAVDTTPSAQVAAALKHGMADRVSSSAADPASPPPVAAPDGIPSATSISTQDATPSSLSGQAMQASALPAPAPAGEPEAPGAPVQVGSALLTLASSPDGSNQLTVSLHPKELGSVRVQINRDGDGSVKIVVAASEPSTLRSLMNSEDHLQAVLDAANVRTTDRQLSFELATTGATSNDASQVTAPDRQPDAATPSAPSGQSIADMSGFRTFDQQDRNPSQADRGSDFSQRTSGAVAADGNRNLTAAGHTSLNMLTRRFSRAGVDITA